MCVLCVGSNLPPSSHDSSGLTRLLLLLSLCVYVCVASSSLLSVSVCMSLLMNFHVCYGHTQITLQVWLWDEQRIAKAINDEYHLLDLITEELTKMDKTGVSLYLNDGQIACCAFIMRGARREQEMKKKQARRDQIDAIDTWKAEVATACSTAQKDLSSQQDWSVMQAHHSAYRKLWNTGLTLAYDFARKGDFDSARRVRSSLFPTLENAQWRDRLLREYFADIETLKTLTSSDPTKNFPER